MTKFNFQRIKQSAKKLAVSVGLAFAFYFAGLNAEYFYLRKEMKSFSSLPYQNVSPVARVVEMEKHLVKGDVPGAVDSLSYLETQSTFLVRISPLMFKPAVRKLLDEAYRKDYDVQKSFWFIFPDAARLPNDEECIKKLVKKYGSVRALFGLLAAQTYGDLGKADEFAKRSKGLFDKFVYYKDENMLQQLLQDSKLSFFTPLQIPYPNIYEGKKVFEKLLAMAKKDEKLAILLEREWQASYNRIKNTASFLGKYLLDAWENRTSNVVVIDAAWNDWNGAVVWHTRELIRTRRGTLPEFWEIERVGKNVREDVVIYAVGHGRPGNSDALARVAEFLARNVGKIKRAKIIFVSCSAGRNLEKLKANLEKEFQHYASGWKEDRRYLRKRYKKYLKFLSMSDEELKDYVKKRHPLLGESLRVAEENNIKLSQAYRAILLRTPKRTEDWSEGWVIVSILEDRKNVERYVKSIEYYHPYVTYGDGEYTISVEIYAPQVTIYGISEKERFRTYIPLTEFKVVGKLTLLVWL